MAVNCVYYYVVFGVADVVVAGGCIVDVGACIFRVRVGFAVVLVIIPVAVGGCGAAVLLRHAAR